MGGFEEKVLKRESDLCLEVSCLTSGKLALNYAIILGQHLVM